MQRSHIPRVVWACAAALAALLAAPLATAAQEQIGICHRPSSTSNQWVFMTIDIRLWSEYEARGDRRAASSADCMQPTPAAQAAPASAVQQPASQATAVPTGTVAPAATVPTAAATAAATVETAGVAVSEPATAPDVSTLPRGGGEPDRLLLVLGLFALAVVGVTVRRLARGAS